MKMRTRKISSIEFENFQITVEFRFTKDEQSEKIQDTCLLKISLTSFGSYTYLNRVPF